jgi:probable HAF family extracellular repeat protein
MKKLLVVSVWCVLLCFSASALAQVKYQQLTSPIQSWINVALSKDGKVMAANIGGELFRWTASTGFVDLGLGDTFNSSIGISADGNTIVAGLVGPDGNSNPAMWQQATGWVNLGHPAEGCVLDGSWGDAWGVSGDGSIVVGLAWYCPGAEGFQWTKDGGIVGLGHPTNASSRATTISADGSTIVGFYEDPVQGFRRPVRWISGSTDLFLGNIAGEAIGVSSDGSQITGQAADSTGNGRAFYYTSTGGLVDLGVLSGNKTDQSVGIGVSDNGIVIGASINNFTFSSQPFIWSSKMGLHHLQATLARNGAVIPSNVTLSNVLAISADGSTIAGLWFDTNFNQGPWIVHLHGKASLSH